MTKCLLISGGTKGLGAAVSKKFATHDYHIQALYHTELENVDIVNPSNIDYIKHDVAKMPFNLICPEKLDEIVIIHNAAASFTPRPMHLSDLSDYRRHWDTAVGGAHNLIYPNLHLINKVSRFTVIAILSSIVEEGPPKGFAPYLSAKMALNGLIKSISVEFGWRGVRSICICPTFMSTSLTKSWDERLQQSIGNGNILTTGFVAAKIFDLTHNIEAPMNGQNYLIKAGDI